MLPADVYARYLRAAGHEVLAICATDEHGTPAELAALAEGVRTWPTTAPSSTRSSASWASGSGSPGTGSAARPRRRTTTSPRTSPAGCAAEGYTEIRSTEQVYSVADGRFLPDRYVVGTCPNCGYERARGDQCENCGKQLDPTELIDPRSAVSGSTDARDPRLRPRVPAPVPAGGADPGLGRHQGRLAPAHPVDRLQVAGRGPARTGASPATWTGGSRSTPTDFPEAAGKVWYVWFDAPIGYLGATREWADAGLGGGGPDAAFDRWWRTDRGAHDVTYTQFMGKDNVPFHTLSASRRPSSVRASPGSWSTGSSRSTGSPTTAASSPPPSTAACSCPTPWTCCPADCWRWYLMANAPESDDASFTWELFGDAVNKDLVGTFGNFVNRTVTQVVAPLRRAWCPTAASPSEDARRELWQRVGDRLGEYLGAPRRPASSARPLPRCGRCGPRATSTSRPASRGRRSRSTGTEPRARCAPRCTWSPSSTPWPRSPSCLLPPPACAPPSAPPARRRLHLDRGLPDAARRWWPRVTASSPSGAAVRKAGPRGPRGVGRPLRRGGGSRRWLRAAAPTGARSPASSPGRAGARQPGPATGAARGHRGVSAGCSVGYAVGYPLRFVEYDRRPRCRWTRADLAGEVEVADALVSAEDLGATVDPGRPCAGLPSACSAPTSAARPRYRSDAAVDEGDRGVVRRHRRRPDHRPGRACRPLAVRAGPTWTTWPTCSRSATRSSAPTVDRSIEVTSTTSTRTRRSPTTSTGATSRPRRGPGPGR